ncbi:hypothetical protein CL634_09350 [bacterium]|nr:hypothetical protein [bacterium]|tara:strand:+ start:1181 stop:1636 length:456 start_codon:yes stop_codon:yes gene_type:complete
MPSDPVYLEAWKKIAELIGVDYAAGYSGLDLTDRVLRGSMPEAPVVPSACIFMFDVKEDFGQVLTRYQAEITYEIYAFCGGSSLEDRIDTAARLGADMINSLTSDRTLGLAGKIDDVLCSFLAMDGDRYGIDGMAIAYLEIKVKFQSDRGV